MITLVLICIVGIVPVSTLECPQKYGVLRKTADLYTKWARNQVNNNFALYDNEIPLIEGNNTWVFTTNNNTVTLNVPVEDRNTSNYLYKVNSILIQTWNNDNNNSNNNNNNNNNNNVTCSHLGSLNLFNIFVRFKIGSNTVSYRLPNSVYQLTEQELALEVAFNEFTSGEVQVLLHKIEVGQNICLRFDFIGTIVTETNIIGYETTMADSKTLPDYEIAGIICDTAYNICSGGISSYLFGKDVTDVKSMADPKNLLTWNCIDRQTCPISFKLILDYNVLITKMVISGVTDVNKYLPLIQIQGENECSPGETSFGGTFEQFQLYHDYYRINMKRETNIFSFNICLELGEEATIYRIDLFDVYDNKILVQENCAGENFQELMFTQIPVVVVTVSAVLLTIILSVVIVYLARKTTKQQKLISRLSKTSKLESLEQPLLPTNDSIQDTAIYDTIGTQFPQMVQSDMSKVDFIENETLYGRRTKLPHGVRHNVTHDCYNQVNSSESFSEYNNLEHL